MEVWIGLCLKSTYATITPFHAHDRHHQLIMTFFPMELGVAFKILRTTLLQAASTNGLDLEFGVKPIVIVTIGLGRTL